jgi:CRISPR-associated protein Csm5
MASINLDLYLHVLTPVHVGGSDDKHLVEGLDYLLKDAQVYIFDQKKLRNAIANDSQYINALEQGKDGITNLIYTRRISLADVSHPPKRITGSASEIKACIKNGMNGKPYLPGSSIKGALRSMIFKKVFGNSGETVNEAKNKQRPNGRPLPPEDFYLGNFQDGLMRFIQVSDVYFDNVETEICNAKIFNLQYNGRDRSWIGGWKHQLNGGTNHLFATDGFTFAYESIPANSIGRLRVSFDENLFTMASNSRSLNIKESVKRLFSGGFETSLKGIIHQHTQDYLKNEVGFFSKKDFEVQQTNEILSSLKFLENANSNHAPVFRMSSGSGFHSITGDWQFSDHINTGIDRRTDKLRYKSRRLLFDEVGKSYSFIPMGFVQLCTPAYYEHNLKEKIQAAQEAAEAGAIAAENARKEQEEAERLAAEEAKKPVWKTLAEVKKDGFLDGEVVGQQGLNVLIKPFVNEFEKQTLPIRYPAGFPIGSIVITKANVQGKNIILTNPIKLK